MVYLFFSILIFLAYFLPLSIVLLIKKFSSAGNYLRSSGHLWRSSWILGLAVLLLFVSAASFGVDAVMEVTWQNFLLHFVGGGMVVSLIFAYLRQTLTFKIAWPLQLLLLYFLVSGFGAGNELLEFLLDWISKASFSGDRMDTWRDLVANTSGAFLGWFMIQIFSLFLPKKG